MSEHTAKTETTEKIVLASPSAIPTIGDPTDEDREHALDAGGGR